MHDGWMNYWMNDWMKEWMNDWMKEWMNEWVSEWMNEWINKSINQWINRFADLIFQKCSETLSFFFTIFMWIRALATVLCTDCRQLLQIEARTRGKRDPTSATAKATLPEKHRVSPESLSSLNSRVPDQLHFPTTWWSTWWWWWWWWCGWHDGENAANDNHP